MIKTLAQLDAKQAAGVLASAALSLGYAPNVFAPSNPNADIEKVLKEVRDHLGIPREDQSPEAIERLAEFLDEEADRLLTAPDTSSALSRLAERGNLPSDLYEVNIIPNVVDVYGNYYKLEKDIIETTIRSPNSEQHYGPPVKSSHEPSLISLFVKQFRTRWPLKDFMMLVAAQRDGLVLNVHQAWRIYPSRVHIAGIKKPVDLLRAFAEVYGVDISVGNETGRFFLFLSGPAPNEVKWEQGPKKKTILTRCARKNNLTGVEDSALVFAIDVTKYRNMLKEMHVRREYMIDDFVPASVPRPRN